jgi:hypothetical protein
MFCNVFAIAKNHTSVLKNHVTYPLSTALEDLGLDKSDGADGAFSIQHS